MAPGILTLVARVYAVELHEHLPWVYAAFDNVYGN